MRLKQGLLQVLLEWTLSHFFSSTASTPSNRIPIAFVWATEAKEPSSQRNSRPKLAACFGSVTVRTNRRRASCAIGTTWAKDAGKQPRIGESNRQEG